MTEMLEPRSKGAKPASDGKMGTGRGTLRLRSKGQATVEDEVCLSCSPPQSHKAKPVDSLSFSNLFTPFIVAYQLICPLPKPRSGTMSERKWKVLRVVLCFLADRI